MTLYYDTELSTVVRHGRKKHIKMKDLTRKLKTLKIQKLSKNSCINLNGYDFTFFRSKTVCSLQTTVKLDYKCIRIKNKRTTCKITNKNFNQTLYKGYLTNFNAFLY